MQDYLVVLATPTGAIEMYVQSDRGPEYPDDPAGIVTIGDARFLRGSVLAIVLTSNAKVGPRSVGWNAHS